VRITIYTHNSYVQGLLRLADNNYVRSVRVKEHQLEPFLPRYRSCLAQLKVVLEAERTLDQVFFLEQLLNSFSLATVVVLEMHVCVYGYIHAYIYIYIYIYVFSSGPRSWTHFGSDLFFRRPGRTLSLQLLSVFEKCIYVYIYACVYINTCMYIQAVLGAECNLDHFFFGIPITSPSLSVDV